MGPALAKGRMRKTRQMTTCQLCQLERRMGGPTRWTSLKWTRYELGETVMGEESLRASRNV